jgi:hypothetical protein
MKRLFTLAVAAGVVWAGGCKSTTTQTSGGAIERLPIAATTPKASEAPADGVHQTAAAETKGDVIPALWRTPATGGECSH